MIAGFGGQGIILAGKLLAHSAMRSNLEVTYMPSYGAEVRGGTAKCIVCLSDEPVACPITTHPDTLIALNQASMLKYTPWLKPGGTLIYNSSSITQAPDRTDIEIIAVPVDQIAAELGSPKSANMVALGAYLGQRHCLDLDTAVASLTDVLAQRYHKTIPVNEKALRQGAAFTKN